MSLTSLTSQSPAVEHGILDLPAQTQIYRGSCHRQPDCVGIVKLRTTYLGSDRGHGGAPRVLKSAWIGLYLNIN